MILFALTKGNITDKVLTKISNKYFSSYGLYVPSLYHSSILVHGVIAVG